MKSIYYGMLMLVTGAFLFASCGDDDNGPVVANNPAGDAEGKYSGTWTLNIVTETKDAASTQIETKEVNSTGYVQFSAEGQSFVTKATFYTDDAEALLQADSDVRSLNITKSSDNSFIFYNTSANKQAEGSTDPADPTQLANDDGVKGTINTSGVLETSFKYTTKEEKIIRWEKVKKKGQWVDVPVYGTVTIANTWSFSGSKQ
ncbi:MAG: hypothetical protein IJ897_02855 [Prevotella sp.]|nr:hypothetical protein [Prevotella sp.]MBR4573103.1 hypothetical protein [Prevotella sp.]